MALNTPTDYYFLMPLFGEAITGSAEETRTRKRYDLSKHPVVGRYITYFNDQTFSSRFIQLVERVAVQGQQAALREGHERRVPLDSLAAAIERAHATQKEADVRAWRRAPSGRNSGRDRRPVSETNRRAAERTGCLQQWSQGGRGGADAAAQSSAREQPGRVR